MAKVCKWMANGFIKPELPIQIRHNETYRHSEVILINILEANFQAFSAPGNLF